MKAKEKENDVAEIDDAVFGFADKFSERTALLSERKDITTQLQHYDNQCGYCDKWMTKECQREVSNLSGFSRGPGSDGIKCSKFEQNERAKQSASQKKQRLDEINRLLKGE